MIFYLTTVLLSLYALWLAIFRTYCTDVYGRPTTDRFRLPNIVYMMIFVVSFVPIANIFLFIVFVFISLVGRRDGDFYVKSWLFNTLGEKEEEEEES